MSRSHHGRSKRNYQTPRSPELITLHIKRDHFFSPLYLHGHSLAASFADQTRANGWRWARIRLYIYIYSLKARDLIAAGAPSKCTRARADIARRTQQCPVLYYDWLAVSLRGRVRDLEISMPDSGLWVIIPAVRARAAASFPWIFAERRVGFVRRKGLLFFFLGAFRIWGEFFFWMALWVIHLERDSICEFFAEILNAHVVGLFLELLWFFFLPSYAHEWRACH